MDELRLSGKYHIPADVETDVIVLKGAGQGNGKIRCKSLTSKGSLTMRGDIDSDTIELCGKSNLADVLCKSFFCKGALSAFNVHTETCTIRFSNDCKVKSISANCISIIYERNGAEKKEAIKAISSLLSLKLSENFADITEKSCFLAEIISGDKVFVERTNARILIGKCVEIGNGCKIDKVYYSDTCTVLTDDFSGEIIKGDAPV